MQKVWTRKIWAKSLTFAFYILKFIIYPKKFDLKKRDYEGLKFDEIIAFQKEENNNKKITKLQKVLLKKNQHIKYNEITWY